MLHNLKELIFQTQLFRWAFVRPLIAKVRQKEKINVLFIAISPAIWKVDSLYKALQSHKRFEPDILISPNMYITCEKLRREEMYKLKLFFDEKGYDYQEWCDYRGNTDKSRIPNSYDIIIYPQPYPNLIPRPFDYINNYPNKLLICCQYAFHSGNQNWAYNFPYQNMAWIDCYENNEVKQLSCKEKRNKGTNSFVTGLPFADEFKKESYISPWKPQKRACKKIIWSPHWTISQENAALPCYSNFLKMADYMLEFAKSQIGHMQFTFKPHPWLKRELLSHPDWGKERTELYYKAWEDGENLQLAQGEYVDLFMTSDVLVHDCSSFCCEYMYTGKPVFFMARNLEKQTSELNEMSYAAFHAQYIGQSLTELEFFFKEQVIKGIDPMKEVRAAVVRKYLLPPNGKQAADNIIAEILGRAASL